MSRRDAGDADVTIRNDGPRDMEDLVTISMPVEPDANDLLSRDPLALLIAMLLDQQVPLERAFSAPYDLARRLGHEPTAPGTGRLRPGGARRGVRGAAGAAPVPEVHGRPRSGAVPADRRRYDGDARRVWNDAADGTDLRKRVAELPGFGAQKAQIFVALLGKQLGVQPAGWREAAGAFGAAGTYCSVADICDEDSLARVRAYKQQLKAAAKTAAAAGRGPGAAGKNAGRGGLKPAKTSAKAR